MMPLFIKTHLLQRPSTKLLSVGKLADFVKIMTCLFHQPATACNPYMIGHVADELRQYKFRKDLYIRWYIRNRRARM